MNIYDDIDVKRAYATGFWVGVLSGTLCTMGLLIIVGLYYSGWQLP